jgi:hypothetical protein
LFVSLRNRRKRGNFVASHKKIKSYLCMQICDGFVNKHKFTSPRPSSPGSTRAAIKYTNLLSACIHKIIIIIIMYRCINILMNIYSKRIRHIITTYHVLLIKCRSKGYNVNIMLNLFIENAHRSAKASEKLRITYI